ncbi:glycosyltransferase family 4 protein [Thermodesulfatator atlanticus]|uniref:glycosyltransferase family 4 protein n=1 Tax=Thermodesulfatator atlanticus TaxID=501497 RepID=UPI0003B38503|nr:glycosyltransferase family 4 protein [Thermodesulfatator atlanticus]
MHRQLKILHTEASLGWGGQEIRVLKELVAFQERGYSVALAAPEESKIAKKAKKHNIKVFEIPIHQRSLKITLNLRNIVQKHNIDIIHTHSSRDSWHGLFVKKLTNKILVRTRHLSTPVKRNFFSKILYSSADYLITTGRHIKEYFITVFPEISSRIESIPTGIDIEKFCPNSDLPFFKKGEVVLGCVSVLRSWKGHRYLIPAFKELVQKVSDIKLIIVGDGPQRNNLINMVKELGLTEKVEFLGYQEDIPDILAVIDIFIHPSTGHEGVPQAVLQALAMKRPVIATNVGAIPEVIIHKQTGILIPPANPGEIKNAIFWMMKNPDLAKKLGENGRKLVEEKYSLDKMVDKIEKIYQELIRS